MHKFSELYFYNQQIHTQAPLLCADILHGYNVFTTLRMREGAPIFWNNHYERLQSNCKFLDINCPSEKILLDSLKSIYIDRPAFDLRVRITVAPQQWFAHAKSWDYIPVQYYQNGISLFFSDIKVHPLLANIKSGNYLPYRLAYIMARKAHAFEALLIDEKKNIVDASKSSPLYAAENKLWILEGGLASITREAVVAQAQCFGLSIFRGNFKKANLTSGQFLIASTSFGLLSEGAPRFNYVRNLIDFFKFNSNI